MLQRNWDAMHRENDFAGRDIGQLQADAPLPWRPRANILRRHRRGATMYLLDIF
jgi:hypothetical protein